MIGMGIEKYIAAASLGLFIMFVGEVISVFNFMIIGADYDIEPDPKLYQFISIGVAPAGIMAGVSFIMSKRYGSKQIGSMIITGGAILLVGMIISFSMIDAMPEKYKTQTVLIIPPLFIAVSIPVMIVGGILFKIKKKRPKKEYF